MQNQNDDKRSSIDGNNVMDKTMERETRLFVDAEFVIRHRETAKEESMTVKGIECVWHWDDGTRDAAEYWAVIDWVSNTFGNNIDWFSIKSWTGSPKKEEG
tara:strand:- start:264 stop:566 length:303 start_codon:yes stop_codon:yes gene_type:complete